MNQYTHALTLARPSLPLNPNPILTPPNLTGLHDTTGWYSNCIGIPDHSAIGILSTIGILDKPGIQIPTISKTHLLNNNNPFTSTKFVFYLGLYVHKRNKTLDNAKQMDNLLQL